jgi:hypothetical protein
VSAYELESLPLPAVDDLKRLVGRRVDRVTVDVAAARLYGAYGP